jgi:hypothetical protein
MGTEPGPDWEGAEPFDPRKDHRAASGRYGPTRVTDHRDDGSGRCAWDWEPFPCEIAKVFAWLEDPDGGKPHVDEMREMRAADEADSERVPPWARETTSGG